MAGWAKERTFKRALTFRSLWEHPFGRAGLLLIAFFGLMALLHPLLLITVWPSSLYHPTIGFDPDAVPHPTAPSWRHPLGTDPMGRDVLSQLLYGSRTSFGVGLVAGGVAAVLATLIGVGAGYFGSWADTLLMGLSDIVVLMPPPVVLLIIGLLLDLDWLSLGVIYGFLAGLGVPAIITRTHVVSVKVRPFVDAARIAGGGGWHIVRRHLLPFVLPLSFLFLAFTATGAVLTETILSFFGRTQMRLSWGTMIWFTQITFRWSPAGEPWNALLPPVISIMLFCSAFYLLGWAVEEIAEPA
ncbi:MAG: ABC transporter permease [Thermoflexales bacterium]|nr:ABC transporter permease [Thermoflexales bacterium]